MQKSSCSLRVFFCVIEMLAKLLKLDTPACTIFISGERRDELIIDAVQFGIDCFNVEKRVVGEFNIGLISEIEFTEGHLPGRFFP
jgi:hypothetical protein